MDYRDTARGGRPGRHGRHAAAPRPVTVDADTAVDVGIPTFGGLTPVRELGRGSSAVVWLARSERDGALFAVKCLQPGAGLDADAVRREIRLSSESHEHLIGVHDLIPVIFPEGETIGLVMDYAAGGSLGQLVRYRGRLAVGEAVTVLIPMAQVLSYLHQRGTVHGDVSPGNVLLTGQGKPILSDLGLGRMVGDPQQEFAGTGGFMDPQEPADGSSLQPARDLYSLAALGWFMLTGTPPEEARGRPPLTLLVPEVPPSLAVVLEAGLHADVSERPTAAEFARAVFRCAAPEPVDLYGSVHPSVMPELLTMRSPERRKRLNIVRGLCRSVRASIGPAHGLTPRLPRRFQSSRFQSIGAGRNEAPKHPVQTADFAAGDRGNPALRRALLVCLPVVAILGVGVALATGSMPHIVPAVPAATVDPGNDVPAKVAGQLGSQDPVEAVRGLAALRSQALRTGSVALLTQVTVAGSPAAISDERLGAELTEAGVMLEGFATVISTAELRQGGTADAATVRVLSSSSAYQERTKSGAIVRTKPASEAQLLDLSLKRHEGAWRITDIRTPD